MKELKKYENYEDVPLGEWVLVSNARGGLYGHREDDDEIFICREVVDVQDDAEYHKLLAFEDWQLAGMAKFLSGKYGFDTPDKMGDDDGHPCYGSLEDAPPGSWWTIAFTGGCIACYRFPDGGVFLADGAWYPTGELHGPPPAPLFYPEEYRDVIQFFAGSGGLGSLDEVEGGLVR